MMRRLGLCLLALVWTCAPRARTVRTQPEVAESEPAAPAPTDDDAAIAALALVSASQLDVPLVQSFAYPIGPNKLLAVHPTSKNRGDYYHYSVCPVGSTTGCTTGDILAETRLIADLPPAPYNIAVAPCLRPERVKGAPCGRTPAPLAYTQKPNGNADLSKLLAKVRDINQKIRSFAPTIQTDLQAYAKNHKKPTDQTDQAIAEQIAMGPHSTAELINGAGFGCLFTRLRVQEQDSLSCSEFDRDPNAEAPARDDDADIAALRKEVNDLRNDKVSGKGSLLIAIGVSTILVGVVAFGTGVGLHLAYKAQDQFDFDKFSKAQEQRLVDAMAERLGTMPEGLKLSREELIALVRDQIAGGVDGVMATVERIINGPFAGSTLTEADLQIRPSASGKGDHFIIKGANGDVMVRKITIEVPAVKGGRNAHSFDQYVRDNGIVEAVVERYSVGAGDPRAVAYRNGSSLFSTDLPAEFNEISAEEWGKLDATTKNDFKKGTNGRYKLEPVFHEYQLIEGKVYRMAGPTQIDRFPKLRQDVIDRLYRDWWDRVRMGTDAEWGKGVPLFDTQGRLVEPPDALKMRGGNWFSDPPAFRDNVWWPSGPDTEIKIGGTTYSKAKGNIVEFKYANRGFAGWVGNLDVSLFRTNVGLQYTAFAQKANVANLASAVDGAFKPAPRIIGPLPPQAPTIGEHLKTVKKGTLAAAKGFYALSALAVFIGPTLIGAGVNGALLTGSDREMLVAKLEAIEGQIRNLHADRLELLIAVNKLLRDGGFAVPDPEWIYFL